MKVPLYVYRSGMVALLQLIHHPSQYSLADALNTLTLDELVLIEWRGKITTHNLLTWQLREHNKRYTVNLPVSVAVALWKALRRVPLSPDLQELSDELDRQLTNAGFSIKNLTFQDHD
ncbi:hypothetical protein GGR92_003638 [Spirosoma lacussanchae]|uniref:hypothetical protein n=1 Tax=Spirosoma lacussanchae TaxID=1884249 RepID=UPI0011085553|nr:hypothetical protein [Spirosoma lacussanchae]